MNKMTLIAKSDLLQMEMYIDYANADVFLTKNGKMVLTLHNPKTNDIQSLTDYIEQYD